MGCWAVTDVETQGKYRETPKVTYHVGVRDSATTCRDESRKIFNKYSHPLANDTLKP